MKNFCLVLLVLFTLTAHAWAQPDYPAHYDYYVNDFANVITENDREALIQSLSGLKAQTGIEMVVVTINSLADYNAQEVSLPDYTANLFDDWGVGDKEKNNGVMILFSLNDREVWIEMGAGYAHQYDTQLQNVVNNRMVVYFRNGEYSRGLYEGTINVMGLVTGGASGATSGSYAYEEPSPWPGIIFIAVIVVLIVLFIAAAVNFFRKGKKGWGFVFLSIAGVLIVFLIKMLFSGKKGGGGGFGGGRSGGGGAGGRW